MLQRLRRLPPDRTHIDPATTLEPTLRLKLITPHHSHGSSCRAMTLAPGTVSSKPTAGGQSPPGSRKLRAWSRESTNRPKGGAGRVDSFFRSGHSTDISKAPARSWDAAPVQSQLPILTGADFNHSRYVVDTARRERTAAGKPDPATSRDTYNPAGGITIHGCPPASPVTTTLLPRRRPLP